MIYFKNHGGRSANMRKGIHPQYNKVTVVCVSCGNTFESGSTNKEVRVDTCSKCHPFYTGEQKFVQAAGRIDRFNKKASLAQNKDK
jgi:large subunit ribosomal protein L31